MKRAVAALALLFCAAACTTRYQVRGTERIYSDPAKPLKLEEFVLKEGDSGKTLEQKKAMQTALEHQSVEYWEGFSTGVIEISDDADINRAQYDQVLDMVEKQTKNGGLLVVFVHGWHHGPRTCDRDLCCFRRVLEQLNAFRKARQAEVLKVDPSREEQFRKESVVGLYVGWRGESLAVPYLNTATLWDRKRVAENNGRTAGKELLLELDKRWREIPNLTMVTVGHSLGGAFVYQAMKGKLTGNVSDIELKRLRDYRITRAHEDRVQAINNNVKADRADLGDLVVLVNPAIEAIEYVPFDRDLKDNDAPTSRAALIAERLPYDKNTPYKPGQMPVLMVVASRADKAVSLALPPARWLEALVKLRWNRLLRPVELVGMGRYDPYMTHYLNYTGPVERASPHKEKLDSPTCDCPMSYAGVKELQGFSLQKMGEPQKFAGYELDLTPERRARGWDPNSPYFSVYTDAKVIDSHSDIFNSRFVGFLTAFINAYDERQRLLGPKEKDETPGTTTAPAGTTSRLQ